MTPICLSTLQFAKSISHPRNSLDHLPTLSQALRKQGPNSQNLLATSMTITWTMSSHKSSYLALTAHATEGNCSSCSLILYSPSKKLVSISVATVVPWLVLRDCPILGSVAQCPEIQRIVSLSQIVSTEVP